MAALLDPSAPFVRAVLALMDDGADLEPAIAALVAAERRHGVRVLREEAVGSLATVWTPVRAPRPTLRELRALMLSHPSARGDLCAAARTTRSSPTTCTRRSVATTRGVPRRWP